MTNRFDSVTIARGRCKQRELILMALIERLRHSNQPATANNAALHIKGAPVREVQIILDALVDHVGVLDRLAPGIYAVNQLGCEVLMADIEGFGPSPTEQIRRDAKLASTRQ